MNEQHDIIIIPNHDLDLLPESAAPFAAAAAVANRAAAHHLFAEYRRRRAANTTKRQDEDLVLFGAYLRQAQIILDARPELALNLSPVQWAGLDWGIVQGFVAWMLQRGYALATINSRLSTIKVYAELAMKAGTVDADNYTRIKTVKGYQVKELRRVDDKRTITRIGKKKAETLLISLEQAGALKQQPDTPPGPPRCGAHDHTHRPRPALRRAGAAAGGRY